MPRNFKTASRGQALPYLIIMMMVLVMCWGMLINIAKLLKDRTMMQNAADNAAISIAVNQARTMNIINNFDLVIESILYDGMPYPLGLGFGAMKPMPVCGVYQGSYASCILFPLLPQIIFNDVSQVAFTPDLMMGTMLGCHCGTGGGFFNSSIVAHVMMYLTETLALTQEGVAKLGPLYSHVIAQEIGKRQEINMNGEKMGADLVSTVPPAGACGLGLLRNKQRIEFFGIEHYSVSVPPLPPVLPSGLHVHCALPLAIGSFDKSWYFANRNEFYKKKITVVARKNPDSSSNKGYPVFGNWIGITWPSMQTMASAAFYNKSGPGQVLHDTPGSGDVHETRVYENWKESYEHGGKWQAQLVPINKYLLMH